MIRRGTVEAAGGVVWRDGDTGPEVLVIHRPRYDDWSLPKGKLHKTESFEAAALREIAEETGVIGVLGPDLGEVRYVDHKGRDKVVRWWAVEATEITDPTDEHEVDEQRWMLPEDARAMLTYGSDRDVLDRCCATVGWR